jgi:hypothetical protein
MPSSGAKVSFEEFEFRKQEQQKFIERVKTFGLNPNDLTFEKCKGGYQFRCLDSGLVFMIYATESKFDRFKYEHTNYTPNRKKFQYIDKPYYLVDVLTTFDKWLKDHVKVYLAEQSAPDPWESFLQEYSSYGSSEKFNETEIAELEKGLDNFPKFLAEKTKIAPDKLKVIIEEVQDLKKSLKSDTKRKWGKRMILFLVEEVWDAVKDDLVMGEVKGYFFKLLSKGVEYLPKMLSLLQ